MERDTVKTRWILVVDDYSDKSKNAINMLYSAFAGYFDYVLPVKLVSDICDE